MVHGPVSFNKPNNKQPNKQNQQANQQASETNKKNEQTNKQTNTQQTTAASKQTNKSEHANRSRKGVETSRIVERSNVQDCESLNVHLVSYANVGESCCEQNDAPVIRD
jgi:hypothetical protein